MHTCLFARAYQGHMTNINLHTKVTWSIPIYTPRSHDQYHYSHDYICPSVLLTPTELHVYLVHNSNYKALVMILQHISRDFMTLETSLITEVSIHVSALSIVRIYKWDIKPYIKRVACQSSCVYSLLKGALTSSKQLSRDHWPHHNFSQEWIMSKDTRDHSIEKTEVPYVQLKPMILW